jgi:hypothetical protein
LKPEDYASLKIFKDAGFTRTIASTWFKPMNIYRFAEAARRNGAWGLLQTTWAGYNLDEGSLDRELKQFAAYILAAEYAWSADSPPPDELPWRADEVLARAMAAPSGAASPQAGYVTSLPGTVARRDGLGAIDRIDGIRFKVGDRATVLGGALASHDVPLPRSVTFKIAATARKIAFLHATEHPAERGERVGEYAVHYSDGASERVPLTYGLNIRALGDPAIARDAVGARIAQDDAGLTVAARVLVWTNPHPDKPVESVTFSTDHPYASPVLLALSGIGGDAK